MTYREVPISVCTLCSLLAQTSLSLLTALPAIAVACRDIDVRNVRALVMGPHETPYEFGFFEVCVVARGKRNCFEFRPNL